MQTLQRSNGSVHRTLVETSLLHRRKECGRFGRKCCNNTNVCAARTDRLRAVIHNRCFVLQDRTGIGRDMPENAWEQWPVTLASRSSRRPGCRGTESSCSNSLSAQLERRREGGQARQHSGPGRTNRTDEHPCFIALPFGWSVQNEISVRHMLQLFVLLNSQSVSVTMCSRRRRNTPMSPTVVSQPCRAGHLAHFKWHSANNYSEQACESQEKGDSLKKVNAHRRKTR